MLGANLVIVAQIGAELSRGQTKFPKILSHNGQMTLKVKVNGIHFRYQLRESQDAFSEQL